jgi:hypothetical protein
MCLALPFSRIGETIRAGFHDPRHTLAEPVAIAALIFNAIVQKCRNGEVFVAAIFENRRGDREQMGDVRCRGPLPGLSPVNMGRIEESAIKPIG